MYFPSPGLLIGFHGCEESLRNDIVSGSKSMIPSTNDHDWLSRGFYFWENNYERALEFANNLPGGKRFSKPAVLGAVLNLDHCLDLLDTKYLRLVQNSYANFEAFTRKSGLVLPQNKRAGSGPDLLKRNLDCAVIEYLHNMHNHLIVDHLTPLEGYLLKGTHYILTRGFKKRTIFKYVFEILIVLRVFLCPGWKLSGLKILAVVICS